MATLNLGRVRIVFKGDFASNNGVTLEFFDAVTYGGSLYLVTANTVVVDDSDTGNRPPTVAGQASFLKITQGVEFLGRWEDDGSGTAAAKSARIYYPNQIVQFGPNTYIAVQEVPADRPDPFTEVYNETGYWTVLAKGFGNYIPNYDGTQTLDPGDIVNYQSSLWLAISTVDPGETPATNSNLFDRLDGRLDAKGQWQSGVIYELSDTVVFHGSTYTVIANSTNNVPVNNDGSVNNDWEILTEGFAFAGEYDFNNQEGYYKNEMLIYAGATYLVLQKTIFGQTPDNSPSYFQLIVPSDAIKESDFTVDGFIVRSNAEITVDQNTYLTQNQNITITGQGAGSGTNSIPLSLTVDAITDQALATDTETTDINTRLFGSVNVGGGVFELRQIDANLLRPDVVTDFEGSDGIERTSSESGGIITLGVNDKIIANLDPVTETNLVPDIAASDEFMIRDTAEEKLYAVSYQQLLNKLNTQIIGGQVDGVTNFRALIDTPTSYSGFGGGYLRVNEAENAIEFAEDDILLQILIFG